MPSTCAACLCARDGLPELSAAFVVVFGHHTPADVWRELSEHARTHPASSEAMYCIHCRQVTILAHTIDMSKVMIDYALMHYAMELKKDGNIIASCLMLANNMCSSSNSCKKPSTV